MVLPLLHFLDIESIIMAYLPIDPKKQAYLNLNKELECLQGQLIIIQQQMKKAQQCVETIQNFAILSKSM